MNKKVRTIPEICMLAIMCYVAVSAAAVPQNIRAIPGNGIVTIVWERPDTSSTYNLYRSTTQGNTGSTPLAANYKQPPYPQLGGLPKQDELGYIASFGDSTVSNGTTYYYQVTAIRNGSESAKSAEVMAQPVSASREFTKDRFLKILPMGNSITAGWITGGMEQSNSGGWRKPLIAHLASNGYDALLVGNSIDVSYQMDDPYHEGWGARVVSDLIPNVKRAFPTYDPDLVLLEIGTNNLAWVYNDMQYVTLALAQYDDLLEIIFETKPDIRLLVSPITPLNIPDGDGGNLGEMVPPFNAGVKKKVDSLKALGKHIEWASELEDVSVADLYDGIHPTQDGYNKMGQWWFNAIERVTIDPTPVAHDLPAHSRTHQELRIIGNGLLAVPADIGSVDVLTLNGIRVLHSASGNDALRQLRFPGAGTYLVVAKTLDERTLRFVSVVR